MFLLILIGVFFLVGLLPLIFYHFGKQKKSFELIKQEVKEKAKKHINKNINVKKSNTLGIVFEKDEISLDLKNGFNINNDFHKFIFYHEMGHYYRKNHSSPIFYFSDIFSNLFGHIIVLIISSLFLFYEKVIYIIPILIIFLLINLYTEFDASFYAIKILKKKNYIKNSLYLLITISAEIVFLLIVLNIIFNKQLLISFLTFNT